MQTRLMSDKVPSKILELLSSNGIIGIPITRVETKRISAGAVNLNYKVIDGEHCFLLKIFSANNLLPIDRKRIFRLQEELAIRDLAPKPLFLSEDNSVYCEQWVEFLSTNVNNNLIMLAETLNIVHTTVIDAPVLALDEHWSAYWNKLSKAKQRYITKNTFDSMQEKLKRYLKLHKGDFVFCHNDLHVSHICDYQGAILDWEYAGIGCRYFDIASCCIINQLNTYQTKDLCNQYALLSGIDESIVNKKVVQAYEFVEFTNKLWFAAVTVDDNKIVSDFI